MSSPRSAKPLCLELRRPRCLAAAIFILHLSAGAAAALVPLPWYLTGTVWAALAQNLAWLMRYRAPLAPEGGVRTVRWDGSGGWQVHRSGDWQDAVLLPDTFISIPLLVLRFRLTGGRRCTVPVTPDRVERAAMRRLRTALLTGRAVGTGPASTPAVQAHS